MRKLSIIAISLLLARVFLAIPSPDFYYAGATPVVQSSKAAEIDYDFSKYRQPDFMRNIYLGRFALVTGPSKDERDPGAAPLMALENRLALAVKVYHNIYSEKCMMPPREPSFVHEEQLVMVHREGFYTWEENVGKPYRYNIRSRYKQPYLDAGNQFGGFRAMLAMLNGSLKSIPSDLLQFIQQEGCQSKSLIQFEENLHRAFTNQPAVQSSKAGVEAAPLYFRGCAPIVTKMKPGVAVIPACACLRKVLTSAMHPEDLWTLEDDFTRENFLGALVSKVGLRDKTAECLR